MERKPSCTVLRNMFDRDLEDQDNEDGSLPLLQEEEFLQKYCWMHHKSFRKLLDMIKEHPVFQTYGVKQQVSVAHNYCSYYFI
jgi:hypothetical protein